MNQNDQPGSAPPDEGPGLQEESSRQEESSLQEEPSRQDEPSLQEEPAGPETASPEPADDPGYLTETGEAAGDDGSVAAIIGGLPAVEGSAWDIGAPLEERGAVPADDQAGQEDRR